MFRESWLVYFFTDCLSIQFLIHPHPFFSTQLVRPPLVTYPSLCSVCVTYGMVCHAISHQLLPTQPCYRECYGLERAFFTIKHFLPCTPSCYFQGFLVCRQFNLKVNRASCWSSKHSPGPTICLNHSNLRKIYMGRLYLRVKTDQSRSINLYGKLVLGNICFEMFASYGIWTLFTVGEYVTSPHILSIRPQSWLWWVIHSNLKQNVVMK